MEKEIADELIRVLKKNESSDFEESFERAFELTKAYMRLLPMHRPRQSLLSLKRCLNSLSAEKQ